MGFQEVDEIVKIRFKDPSKSAYDGAKKEYREKKRLDCKARMLLLCTTFHPYTLNRPSVFLLSILLLCTIIYTL